MEDVNQSLPLIDLQVENKILGEWGQDLVERWSAELSDEDRATGMHRAALLSICMVREARAISLQSQARAAIRYGIVNAVTRTLTTAELQAMYVEPFNHIEQTSSDIVNSRSRY